MQFRYLDILFSPLSFSQIFNAVKFSIFLIYGSNIMAHEALIDSLCGNHGKKIEAHASNFGLMAQKIATRYEENSIKTNWARESWDRIYACCAGDFSWRALARKTIRSQILDALAYEWCKSGDVTMMLLIDERFAAQKINACCLYKKKVCFSSLGWRRFLNEVSAAKRLQVDGNQIKNISVFLMSSADIFSITPEIGIVIMSPIDVKHVGQIVFNDNTLFFMNQSSEIYHPKFDKLFLKFKNVIKQKNLRKEMFCIDGSSVLALFGLRDILSDFDFIVHDERILRKINLRTLYPVEIHNKWHKNVDDIIFNPLNHFYVQGLKVASLQLMKNFKQRRNWPKDKRDILLIQQLLPTDTAAY